jgi:hypothetical protein
MKEISHGRGAETLEQEALLFAVENNARKLGITDTGEGVHTSASDKDLYLTIQTPPGEPERLIVRMMDNSLLVAGTFWFPADHELEAGSTQNAPQSCAFHRWIPVRKRVDASGLRYKVKAGMILVALPLIGQRKNFGRPVQHRAVESAG